LIQAITVHQGLHSRADATPHDQRAHVRRIGKDFTGHFFHEGSQMPAGDRDLREIALNARR
jgi:lipopolysaccharide biosynthesis regulator YciM